MAETRPFPPSPRRLALARQAGLTAASPHVVAAAAMIAAVVALPFAARSAVRDVGASIAAACRGADHDAEPELAAAVAQLAPKVIAIALPVLAAAAIAAIAAHLAQTRSPWLPRRRLDGAPVLDRGAAARGAIAARELAGAAAIAGVAFAWLWTMAPRLARLPSVAPAGDALADVAALIASAFAAIAVGWIALAAVDAVARSIELSRALHMTPAEHREDARLTAADPRWRAYREAAARGPSAAEAVAAAAVLVLGDSAAVAIAWDARAQPTPLRTAVGAGHRARQLLGLARRHGIAVHRDHELAAQLAGGEGVVPERHWPRLAEIIAAVRAR